MRALDSFALALIAGSIGVASCWSCDPPVEAQIPARLAAGGAGRHELAEVSIARFLCGESDGRKTSAAPLLWTMQRRADARGMRLVSMLHAYSMPLLGHGGARGAWVRALPALPTLGYRRNWRDALDAARSWLAGTLPDPCVRPTFHFGSAADVRARFPGAVPVDCGDAADDSNVYLTEDGR